MADSKLNIEIGARERVSGTLRGLAGQFRGLAGSIGGITAPVKGLGEAFTGALKGLPGLLTQAAVPLAALGFGVGQVFGKMTEQSGDLGREMGRLSGIFDGVARAAGDRLAPLVSIAADALGGLAGAASSSGDSVISGLGEKLGAAAEKALGWGANIVAQLASGIVQGASSALSWAMDFIGNILSSFLSPGSPPRVAPDLDKWGAGAMTEWLRGFGDAEFGVLENLQGPLQQALGTLADMGAMAAESVGPVFAEMSGQISAALADFQKTGKMPVKLFEDLKKAGGQFGAELAEMARREFSVAKAVREVEDAQRRLDKARQGEDEARDKVAALRAEYKRLLKTGADPALVKAKFEEIKAAQRGLRDQKAAGQEAEKDLKRAQGKLGPLQKQAQLQQKLIKQLLDMARAQIKVQKAAGAGAAGGGGGLGGGGFKLPTPSIPTKGFEDIKKNLLGKLGGIFTPLKEKWEKEIKPTLKGLQDKWIAFTGVVSKFYEEKIKPVVDKIAKLIPPGLIENIGKAIGIVLVLKVAMGAVGVVIGLVGGVLGTLLSPIGLLVAAIALLITAWQNNWLGIRDILTDVWENTLKPALQALWDWLSVNIPKAIETAKEFWDNTLKPALEAVWAFITESLVPALGSVVEWLATNIPVAIEAAKKFWEDTLKPALEAVWTFITDSLLPTLGDVVTWLQDTIKTAIDKAVDLWENTLKPALELVWKFIKDDLLPLFESLKDFFEVALNLALTALAGLWENVLKPALEAVYNFIKDKLQPIFDTLKDFFDTTLKPIIETLADVFETTLKNAWDKLTTALSDTKTSILDPLKNVFDSISNAIQSVINWVQGLTDKLKNISLPDWLTPGSPTPFELGLRGIAKELTGLARLQMPGLFKTRPGMGLAPALALAGGGVGSLGGAMVRGGDLNLTVNLSGGASREDALRVADAIERKLRQRGVRRSFS